jgi:hypothetical protein
VAGTHGNEPAGTIALRALATALSVGNYKLPKGSLRIIPAINQWGLDHNIRYHNDFIGILPKSDINRNYQASGGTENISQMVIDLTQNADLVIDFHEGWGYHIIQPKSMGSTLSPTDYGLATRIAQQAVRDLNGGSDLLPPKHPFLVRNNESCTIPTTLGCYMQKNKRAYILVETTGQNNIQPLETRVRQVFKIVFTTLNFPWNKI